MNVLMTGMFGRCGTAVIDHLHDHQEYAFTYYNRSDRPEDHPYGHVEPIVADITDTARLRSACGGQDALVHMAAYPDTSGDWSDILEPNIVGVYSALEAARTANVETFVFLSSNHVMGMYEAEHAPDIYTADHPLVLDHTDPVRPDSIYGASKSFGEDLARYYTESYEYPKQCYILRTCTVNHPAYDHPYGDAEQGVDEGSFERDSAEYNGLVARMKATWQSRRDFAHQIECCLADDSVTYGIFNGVSDNFRRWFDLEHARSRIGYDPHDNAEAWDAPPG